MNSTMTQTRGRLTMKAQKMKARTKAKMVPNKVAREDQRMIMLEETLNANTVTKHTCPIPPFTHIWSRSILRVQMASLEIHRQVEEAEVDQEKIHTRDSIQGPKTSSRLLKEKEAQWILFAVTRKSIAQFSQRRIKTRHNSKKVCWNTRSTSTSFNSPLWSTKTAICLVTRTLSFSRSQRAQRRPKLERRRIKRVVQLMKKTNKRKVELMKEATLRILRQPKIHKVMVQPTDPKHTTNHKVRACPKTPTLRDGSAITTT